MYILSFLSIQFLTFYYHHVAQVQIGNEYLPDMKIVSASKSTSHTAALIITQLLGCQIVLDTIKIKEFQCGFRSDISGHGLVDGLPVDIIFGEVQGVGRSLAADVGEGVKGTFF